jgi:hypothetical protein
VISHVTYSSDRLATSRTHGTEYGILTNTRRRVVGVSRGAPAATRVGRRIEWELDGGMRPVHPGTIYATDDRDGDWPEKLRLGLYGNGPCWVPAPWIAFCHVSGPPAGEVTSSSGLIRPISFSQSDVLRTRYLFLGVDSGMQDPKNEYIAFSCSWFGLLHNNARKCPKPKEPIANRRWHRGVVPLLFHPTYIFQVPRAGSTCLSLSATGPPYAAVGAVSSSNTSSRFLHLCCGHFEEEQEW